MHFGARINANQAQRFASLSARQPTVRSLRLYLKPHRIYRRTQRVRVTERFSVWWLSGMFENQDSRLLVIPNMIRETRRECYPRHTWSHVLVYLSRWAAMVHDLTTRIPKRDKSAPESKQSLYNDSGFFVTYSIRRDSSYRPCILERVLAQIRFSNIYSQVQPHGN